MACYQMRCWLLSLYMFLIECKGKIGEHMVLCRSKKERSKGETLEDCIYIWCSGRQRRA